MTCKVFGERVGYQNQRYEVRALDHDQKWHTIGWTDDKTGGALVEMVHKHPAWRSPIVVDLKPIKIFEMNDCDWMAAANVQEARAFYLEHTGMDAEEAFSDDDPFEVAEDRLEVKKFRDEDGTTRTFREELDRLIAAGQKFPCFFASTEY